MRRVGVGIVAIASTVLCISAGTHACGGAATGEDDNDGQTGPIEDVRTDRARPPAADHDSPPPRDAPPPFVPDTGPEPICDPPSEQGWEPFAGYEPSCRLRWAPNATSTVAPLEWEACPEAFLGAPVHCQMMKPRDLCGFYGARNIDVTGAEPRIGAKWVRKDFDVRENFVALASGAVQVGIRHGRDCGVGGLSSAGEHWLGDLYLEAGGFNGGLLFGTGNQHPQVADITRNQSSGPSYSPVPAGILRLGVPGFRVDLYDWSFTSPVALSEPDGGNATYQARIRQQIGERFVGLAGRLDDQRVYAFEPGRAPVDLLQLVLRPGYPVMSHATDGTHLIWIEGGRGGNREAVDRISVAPFSWDPTSYPSARRDISFPAAMSAVVSMVTRCGYVAYNLGALAQPDGGLAYLGQTIMRLADGARWTLPLDWDGPIRMGAPMAMSCDEVFYHVEEKPVLGRDRHSNIARIRLASLPFVMP